MFSDILLSSDYDHTITARNGAVPQKNLEALRFFMDNGGAFTVNTGRSVPMLRPIEGKVKINTPWLLYTGGAAYDGVNEEFLFAHTIDLDPWKLGEELRQSYPDMTPEIQGVKAHYAFRENPGWEEFSRAQGCAYAYTAPGDDIGPFLKITLYGEFRRPEMEDMYLGSPEELARIDAIEEDLKRRYGEYLEVFRATPRIIDMQRRGVSKGRSAKLLQEELGRKILVCVGDGRNDIPMLQSADYAWCPAGSVIESLFPNVCCCDDGALWDVIYKKIPEILGIRLDK